MKSFKVIISNSSDFNSFSDVKVDNFKEFKISDDGTEINGPGDKKYIFSFKTPALGRYMKIIPVSWNGLISIRLSPIGAKTSNNIDNFIDKDNKANLFENFTVMKNQLLIKKIKHKLCFLVILKDI